jgi:hypothetical protein
VGDLHDRRCEDPQVVANLRFGAYFPNSAQTPWGCGVQTLSADPGNVSQRNLLGQASVSQRLAQ